MNGSASPEHQPAGRIESWKAIAAYLNRDVRTVQRWEKREGLPVHRHIHEKLGTIYAYKAELDVWWNNRAPVLGASAEKPRLRFAYALLAILVFLAGGIAWWRFGRPASAPPPKIIPFTSFPGQESQPAFSPDGNQLAFVWNGEKQDNVDVYVQSIGGGRPLRLTTDPAADVDPAWSPNGQLVAFRRESGVVSEILLVPALGGAERKLAETSGGGLCWHPSGRFLVMVDRSSPKDPGHLCLLSLESGEKQELTTTTGRLHGDHLPVFSPDGRTLAFLRDAGGGGGGDAHLLSLGSDGRPRGEPRRLTFSNRPISGLDWTPDGRHLVFSFMWTSQIRRVPVSGGAPKAVGVIGREAASLAVSRRGRRLAFAPPAADGNIYRLALGEGAAPDKFISSTWVDSEPQYSRDGKRIVFLSNRSGTPEIWACESDGSDCFELTSFGGPTLGSPQWSPDGRMVAFDALTHGSWDVYEVSLDGGPPRRLTVEPSQDSRPSFSNDGKWIFFNSNRTGDYQVWRMPVQRGTAIQMTRSGGFEPLESLDGRFVYYVRLNREGIWRVPTEGGEETRVLDRGTAGRWALFAQGIYLLTTDAVRGAAVEFFDFKTGRLSQIAALPKETIGPSYDRVFAVSPDGRWILYVQIDPADSDIMLVENFLREGKAPR